MQTWFDRDRGVKSGRMKPQVVQPTDGDYVFVLGAEDQDEPAILSAGDYTEVRQVVNLTGCDLISATMKTIGKLIGQIQPRSGFVLDPDTLFAFNFDVGISAAKNLVDSAFDVDADGTVQIAQETYSPDNTYCRRVPQGVGTSKMAGVNTPQVFPATLDEYTVQWWMNWDSNVFGASTGIIPKILKAGKLGGSGSGVEIELSPVAPLHQWRIIIRHSVGATFWTCPFNGYLLDQPLGWKMFTVRFKESLPTQAELFVDASNVAQNPVPLVTPAQYQAGEEISFMSKDLVGDFDQIRFINRWLTDVEITDSYNECVTAPLAISYKWIMQVLVDDRVYAERQIQPSESRTWEDFIAPTRLLTGPHTVAFRLKLETV